VAPVMTRCSAAGGAVNGSALSAPREAKASKQGVSIAQCTAHGIASEARQSMQR